MGQTANDISEIERVFERNLERFVQENKDRDILNVLHGSLIFTEFTLGRMDEFIRKGRGLEEFIEYLSGMMRPLMMKKRGGEEIDDYRMGIIYQYLFCCEDLARSRSLVQMKERGDQIIKRIRDAQKVLVFHLMQHPDMPLDKVLEDIIENKMY